MRRERREQGMLDLGVAEWEVLSVEAGEDGVLGVALAGGSESAILTVQPGSLVLPSSDGGVAEALAGKAVVGGFVRLQGSMLVLEFDGGGALVAVPQPDDEGWRFNRSDGWGLVGHDGGSLTAWLEPDLDEAARAPHACEGMAQALDDGSVPLCYGDRFREYALIVRNSPNVRKLIEFCPWCGEKLPGSVRDEWFERLEALGIEDWDDPRIPPEMHSGDWWRAEAGSEG